jgi:hypothetical protein
MECTHGKTVSPAICKRFHSDPKEVTKMESKTTTTRKPTTRKPAPKATTAKAAATKATAGRKTRKAAAPMPDSVRKAGAAACAAFEEAILEQEDIGFIGANLRELKGTRSGFMQAFRFEVNNVKHRAVVTVVFK